MFVKNLVLPALAVAQVAFAQKCSDDPVMITSQGDAQALGSCQTVKSLTITSECSGDISLGIEQISGDLLFDSPTNLTSVTAGSLGSIGGKWTINAALALIKLSFPELNEVQTISWSALPKLTGLDFATTITTASDVLITNTGLASLQGINLKEVSSFNINNNLDLTDITLQLGNLSGALNIDANGENLKANFPNLETAFNLTFKNVSSVSLPSLSSINATMGCFSNYFDTFAAPNLTKVGGDLVFVDNSDLTNISLPMLTTIGGVYQISNNSKLTTIDGFQALQTVNGAIDFSGAFTDVSLPALQSVAGGFNLQTSGQFDCGPFQSISGPNNKIRGKFVCTGNSKNPGTATSTGGTPKKTGAASHLDARSAGVVGGLMAGLFSFLL